MQWSLVCGRQQMSMVEIPDRDDNFINIHPIGRWDVLIIGTDRDCSQCTHLYS